MSIPIRTPSQPTEDHRHDDNSDSSPSSNLISRRSSSSISSSSSSLSRSRSASPVLRIVNVADDEEAPAETPSLSAVPPTFMHDEVRALIALPSSWRSAERRIAAQLIDGDMADVSAPMTPQFRSAMIEIFHRYASIDNPLAPSAPHRTMSKDDMIRYILSCGASEASTNPYRLENIFTRYVPNEEWTNYDELTCEGFCDFYRVACFDRILNVWSDLKIHHFFSDVQIVLEHDDDHQEEAVDDHQVAQLSLVDEPPPAA